MEVYDRESAPLLDYFRDRGILYEVDGSKSTDKVFNQILRKVGKAA
jgi:adenylate kinase